jgi:hypothetical protein
MGAVCVVAGVVDFVSAVFRDPVVDVSAAVRGLASFSTGFVAVGLLLAPLLPCAHSVTDEGLDAGRSGIMTPARAPATSAPNTIGQVAYMFASRFRTPDYPPRLTGARRQCSGWPTGRTRLSASFFRFPAEAA